MSSTTRAEQHTDDRSAAPRGVGEAMRSGRGPGVGAGRVVEAIGRIDRLDLIADAASRILPDAMRAGRVREVLGGRWLGHPAHPMLTDLPLGMWLSASVLDLTPGDHAAASRRLVTGGLLASVPTVATGWSDWLHANRQERRIGVVHALTNVGAAVLYTASLRARRQGRHGSGVGLALAGAALTTVGGLLGGHLATATETSLRNTADLGTAR